MFDLELIGLIIKMQADNQSNEAITQAAQAKGMDTSNIQAAFDAIDSDEIFTADSLFYITWINPITYTIGVRKITVEKKILMGLMKNTQEVGVRTIDSIRIEENIFSANAIIVHADRSEVRIRGIGKSNARRIQKFFGDVIEAQRKKVINVASD